MAWTLLLPVGSSVRGDAGEPASIWSNTSADVAERARPGWVPRLACMWVFLSVAGASSSGCATSVRAAQCEIRTSGRPLARVNNGEVPPREGDYCSFTKAIEQLGDRWSLLILRQLCFQGPLGFNALVEGLPGRISRSVLNDRLRRLNDLGLIAREGRSSRGVAPYRLTTAGQGLLPVLLALRAWAVDWLPDDPAAVEREPALLVAWLARRIDPACLPPRPVVLEVCSSDHLAVRGWLVLGKDVVPYACVEDPLLEPERYLYARGSPVALLALAAGRLTWADALRDGSVRVDGDPALARRLPAWFDVAAPHRTSATGAPPIGP